MKANKLQQPILRCATLNDAYDIYQLSKQTQSGLTNIPKTLKKTNELLLKHEHSINQKSTKNNQIFLFVLVDKSNTVIG